MRAVYFARCVNVDHKESDDENEGDPLNDCVKSELCIFRQEVLFPRLYLAENLCTHFTIFKYIFLATK